MTDEVVTTPFGKFLINPNDCVGTTLKAGTLWDGPGFLRGSMGGLASGARPSSTWGPTSDPSPSTAPARGPGES